jgi:hypothetical protein
VHNCSYLGPLASISQDGTMVTTLGSAISAECAHGGALVLLNGTGAGQYRRIVGATSGTAATSAATSTTAAAPLPHAQQTQTQYTLDKPFQVAPSAGEVSVRKRT